MKILVTGAKGFVGKNLVCALENIKDGKNKTRPALIIDEVFGYDIDSDENDLERYASKCDFVFNLAGVNRPKESTEFMAGNFGFGQKLLEALEKAGNKCPVMLSSSVQATLIGRYDGDYGRSKKAGEELFFDYGKRTGAPVYVYRFFNLFGKWCRPNYNSAVATFCNNIANDLPITVNDENAEVTLTYIDDLVNEMLNCLEGNPSKCDFDGLTQVFSQSGRYCGVRETYTATLGNIVSLLKSMRSALDGGGMPILNEPFTHKLYSTFLSYIPADKISRELKVNADYRGSFTEIVRTVGNGQFSVNVSNPGITKGEHWHDTKWEIFTVVSGHGLIKQRKIGTEEVIETEVFGDRPTNVIIIPGYTHNIINLSETDPLVTFMWANECFNKDKPDTFGEKV